MISKEEYKKKYQWLTNNDIFRFTEQTIDENIKKDILEDNFILSTHSEEEKVRKILSLLTNKYIENGWENLFFIIENRDTYFSEFPYNYKIKYYLS